MRKAADGAGVHHLLSRMVVEDPRQARVYLLRLLEDASPVLPEFLQRLSAPGEGRLRHLVASAVRTLPERGGLTSYLSQWYRTETDEFTKRAIAASLAGVRTPKTRRDNTTAPLAEPVLVDAYRYVSDRLHHQLRNALMKPNASLLRLRNVLPDVHDETLRARLASLIGTLSDDFLRLGRMIEDFDPEDEYFTVRRVCLSEWLISMNAQYAKVYTPIELNITGSAPEQYCISGSDYLLRTIFWNIWINAQQALGVECRIDMVFRTVRAELEIVIIDNGEGFPVDRVGIAFNEPFTSKARHRGRGLLEVQDAVQRLHGSVSLYEHRSGEYRIRITLPLEKQ